MKVDLASKSYKKQLLPVTYLSALKLHNGWGFKWLNWLEISNIMFVFAGGIWGFYETMESKGFWFTGTKYLNQ